MSVQLEVIKFRDLIRLDDTPKFVTTDVDTPILEITGEDFSSVESVFINGEEMTNYIILSKNRMQITLERSLSRALQSIEVISGNFTKTVMASKITFQLGTKTRTVTGILKLVQLYTKWLLQSPGSDIFNPNRGGGVQELIGQVVSSHRIEHLLSALTRAVQTTTNQIRTAQSNSTNLPLDERLLEATLLGINKLDERMEIRARVHLVSSAGNEATSALIL